MATIEFDDYDKENGYVDVDIEDYLDEVDTSDLCKELVTRSDIPENVRDRFRFLHESKTPLRDSVIDVLDLQTTASIEDVIQALKDNWYK